MPNTDMIFRDDAIALIEGFQRELCPVGMYGRHAVYGSDREKFDDWQFVIDELEKVPAVDAAPVRHGRWIYKRKMVYCCSWCGGVSLARFDYCPHCGAKIGGCDDNEID